MLPTIPDSLLQFAVDGVVPASATGGSAELRRAERLMRRRARAMLEQAAQHANDLRVQAMQEGYLCGMQLAWQSLWPVVEALQRGQSALRQVMWQDIERALRSIAADPGVAAAQIEAACLAWAGGGGDGHAAVLHLPMEQQALAEALRAMPALAGVDIRVARRSRPLLEVGHLVYELDLEGTLAPAAAQALEEHMPQWEAACAELAQSYARRMQEAALSAVATERFSRLRSWHEGDRSCSEP